MATHLCRDLLIGTSLGYATGGYDSMWAAAVFLQGVMGFRVTSTGGDLVPPTYDDFVVRYYSASLGPTTFAEVSSSLLTINTASCFVSSSGSRALLVFSRDAVNFMSAAYPVGWPVSSGSWPTGDPFMGDWVALRSSVNPAVNSGIFAIVDSTGSLQANAVGIDYRTASSVVHETGSYVTASVWFPPPSSDTSTAAGRGVTRTGGTTWSLFNGRSGNGDVSTYQGQGSATIPRMILQSPFSWSVRLCIETDADTSFGGTTLDSRPAFTIVPGFGGSGGDFAPGQLGMTGAAHLHVLQWVNAPYASSSVYLGSMPALDIVNTATTGANGFSRVQYGFYAWGDDSTGTCLFAVRGSTASGSQDAYVLFGRQSDETAWPGQCDAASLFVIGQARRNVGITWDNGTRSNGVTGVTFCTDERFGPLSCAMSCYSYAAAQLTDSGSVRYDAAASVTPFLNRTELIDSELIAGTWDNLAQPGNAAVFAIEPRPMGRVPFARFGRSTGVQRWTPVDDDMSWLHVSNGFYLPWGGVSGST